jgi:hypothetical protein
VEKFGPSRLIKVVVVSMNYELFSAEEIYNTIGWFSLHNGIIKAECS